MPSPNPSQLGGRSLTERIQTAVKALLKGLSQLFSPTDYRYPKTGGQPYEGDPGDRD